MRHSAAPWLPDLCRLSRLAVLFGVAEMVAPPPRLVLQPLVENAVLHGVSGLPEGGTIEIDLSGAEGVLRMQVRNPAPPQQGREGHGAGHAQRSIGHRLAYAYGARARMAAGWEDGYYRCELQVPTDSPPLRS